MLLINQVVPWMPEGVSGQSPVVPMGAGVGTACPSRLLQKVSWKEVINQHMTAGSKRSFSQLRGQREGGKPPDPAEGLYCLLGLIDLSHRRAGGRHRGRGSGVSGAVFGRCCWWSHRAETWGSRPSSGKLAEQESRAVTAHVERTLLLTQLRVSDSSAALRVSSEGLNPSLPQGSKTRL